MEDTIAEDKPKPVKLPYFHRTLSPADAALIGDITPKPIDPSAAVDNQTNAKLTVGSAWNSANTWEERDCTKWALEKLPTLFSDVETLPKSNQYSVTIKSFSNVQGSAQVAHVRGKARFIYEMSFDLKVSVSSDANPETKFKGKVTVSDVINDQLDDIELSVSWTDKYAPPSAEFATVRNTVIGKAMKAHIKAKMTQFENEFRNL